MSGAEAARRRVVQRRIGGAEMALPLQQYLETLKIRTWFRFSSEVQDLQYFPEITSIQTLQAYPAYIKFLQILAS